MRLELEKAERGRANWIGLTSMWKRHEFSVSGQKEAQDLIKSSFLAHGARMYWKNFWPA
jgi:hypothetical protein